MRLDELERMATETCEDVIDDLAAWEAVRITLPALIAVARAAQRALDDRGVNDCGTTEAPCLNRVECEMCSLRAALAVLR